MILGYTKLNCLKGIAEICSITADNNYKTQKNALRYNVLLIGCIMEPML